MSRLPLLLSAILLASSPLAGAEECAGVVRQALVPGTPNRVVVAEGQFEPRSVGSYSVRVYAERNPQFPYDVFVAGAVRPRDGEVEDVRLHDLDHDGMPDIVVVIRSVGTGGYLSADAFGLHGTDLSLLGSVSGLPAAADPVRALETELGKGAAPSPAPEADMPWR